ncbi:hypothetical protein HUJ05_008681 [Dendroctonus ponderosae]|nr:hypothetical protein HUJ05_008681 [Dendroctonus ponderosae]
MCQLSFRGETMDVDRRARKMPDASKGFTWLFIFTHSMLTVSSQVLYEYSPAAALDAAANASYHLNCSICFFNGSSGNSSTNLTLMEDGEPLADFIFMVALSVVLGLMILSTIIGNVFVIAAIFMERNLQNVANYLIVSLAMADLMVACLVMPLGAIYVTSVHATSNVSSRFEEASLKFAPYGCKNSQLPNKKGGNVAISSTRKTAFFAINGHNFIVVTSSSLLSRGLQLELHDPGSFSLICAPRLQKFPAVKPQVRQRCVAIHEKAHMHWEGFVGGASSGFSNFSPLAKRVSH